MLWKLMVDHMLRDGLSADELYEDVWSAVEWIENHPEATRYHEES